MDKYTKAITALVTSALGAWALATIDTSAGGSAVTSQELINLVVISIGAGILVWAVPNEPKSP